MMNIWDQKLVEYFQTNIILDRETEEIRKELATIVSHQRLFEAIDKDSNGVLTISELSHAISKLSRPFNLKYLRRMIKQYDKNGDFSLNYRDFGTFLLPKEHTDDFIKKTEIDVNNTNFELFIDLVLKELDEVQILTEMADQIKTTKEFITYEAFRSIAGTSKYITESNLKEYLIKRGVKVEDMNELAKVIYRYDRNFDGRFGYDEFKDIFSPYSIDSNNNDNDNDYINKSTINNINQSPEKDNPTGNYQSIINKYAKNNHLKLSIQSNNNEDETKEDSYFFSSKHPQSQTQRVPYDYSFEQEIQKEVIDDDEEKRAIPQFSSSLLSNPFKKSLNNAISLTKNRKVDISPFLDKKLNASNYDLVNSNSMLNNSLTNGSFSPNRTIIIPQQQQSSLEEKNSINKPYRELSPLIKFKKQSTNETTINCNKTTNPFTSIQILNKNKTYLLDYFNEIVGNELRCESIREEISKNADMNIPDIFSFFDNSHRIKISPYDLRDSLRKISIIVTMDELNLLYKQYDKDSDGFLKEFCEMILPMNTIHAVNLSKHIPPASYMQLSPDAITLVSNLFYAIFSGVKGCENIRRDNASRRDYSNVDCYEMIKSKQTNSVFKKDIIHFFNKNKVKMTSFEINILMDYFDKDKDGQISFKEFVRETAPKGIVV